MRRGPTHPPDTVCSQRSGANPAARRHPFLNMQNPHTTTAGFFRFPARMVFRSLHLVRAERIACHAAGAVFRHRHADVEPLKPLPVTSGSTTLSRVPAARITVRV